MLLSTRCLSRQGHLLAATFLVVTSLLFLGGCDALTELPGSETDSGAPAVHFEGARHTVERGARTASTAGQVKAQALPGTSPVSAIRIDSGKQGRTDLLFQTGNLKAGEAFTAAALSEEGRVLGRIVHESVGNGVNRVWADVSGFSNLVEASPSTGQTCASLAPSDLYYTRPI